MAEDDAESPERGHEQAARLNGGINGNDAFHKNEKFPHNVLVEEPESMSPLILGRQQEIDDFNLDSGGSRLGQAAKSLKPSGSWFSRHKLVRSPRASPTLAPSAPESHDSHATPGDEANQAKAIVAQAWEWLHLEKQKRRLRRRREKKSSQDEGLSMIQEETKSRKSSKERERRTSSDSDTSTALEQLEEILKRGASISGVRRHTNHRRTPRPLRRATSSRIRRSSTTGGSSDTDHVEKEIHVPTCEAWLDNSRTLSRTTGMSALDEQGRLYSETMTSKELDAWSDFQYEILRIIHTLQLRRWRRVPLERSKEIVVERLSGALTNAVYTVSPPKDLEGEINERAENATGDDDRARARSLPTKLLLRIYGPQVEHLIDRDAELQILRRLCRQNIGPRLLGTFHNGRFEQYLHAKALNPFDLRQPEVSKQIAKRMRELHDGIELTSEERKNGPFVWRNWDKWLGRCERIVTYIDKQVASTSPALPVISRLRNRGYVCGTTWEVFRDTVHKYRQQLNSLYGGIESLKHELCFAHNDTQYGNILRQELPGESPLLLPANVHKQLVVIDFEYANANTRGLEFANHFTEWCYNYHHPESCFECRTSDYPTIEEQSRFLRAYIQHEPQFAPAAMTPRLRASRSSVSTVGQGDNTSYFPTPERQASTSTTKSLDLGRSALSKLTQSSFSSLDLNDTRCSEGKTPSHEDIPLEHQITGFIQEARLWRIANSAQWVAWGIVQARVPGLHNAPHTQIVKDTATEWTQANGEQHAEEDNDDENEDHEFDYLSYARSRAMFFWGDCVQQGLVDLKDLPRDVQEGIKIVRC